MKIGIVAPHIFMQQAILPKVIFSPGELCILLADSLAKLGHEIYLYSPGPVDTTANNINADLNPFDAELKLRGYDYLELLKRHPLTFISLSRQVQSELISRAYQDANNNKLDVVHVYMNEEDIALQFANFCHKPVVFTHHDPFNFSTKYRTVMPKYKQLNWLSMSLAQRSEMPSDTNWVGNVHHGLPLSQYRPVQNPASDYLLFIGRIIESKGLHLAIAALSKYNQANPSHTYRLLIVGKHYSGAKDEYWQQQIMPHIDNQQIIYKGFVNDKQLKNKLLANAAALMVPSIFAEPFGMVTIEALASGTPVIGLATGATPEIIKEGRTGLLVQPTLDPDSDQMDEQLTSDKIAACIPKLAKLNRTDCRQDFEAQFSSSRMANEHLKVYEQLIDNAANSLVLQDD